jgi:hypothetical protein
VYKTIKVDRALPGTPPTEEEKEPTEDAVTYSTVTVEWRNLRGIFSSVKQINTATAAGFRPDLYIFAETFMEHAVQPQITDYTPIAYVQASRRSKIGRASGGLSVYKHNDCQVPARQLQTHCSNQHCEHEHCRASRGISNMLTLEIGGDELHEGKAIITAYYCPRTNPTTRSLPTSKT